MMDDDEALSPREGLAGVAESESACTGGRTGGGSIGQDGEKFGRGNWHTSLIGGRLMGRQLSNCFGSLPNGAFDKKHGPHSVLLRRNRLSLALLDEISNSNLRKVCGSCPRV